MVFYIKINLKLLCTIEYITATCVQAKFAVLARGGLLMRQLLWVTGYVSSGCCSHTVFALHFSACPLPKIKENTFLLYNFFTRLTILIQPWS